MSAYLVTGVGGPAGRAVAAELSRRGRHVVGVDVRDVGWRPYPTRVIPAADSARFVPAVLELCRRYAARVVVPTVPDELPVFAAVRQTASRGGITIVVGDALSVGVASDRWLTFQSLELMSVTVPRMLLAGEVGTAAEVRARLGLPVVRKPRSGRGGAQGVTVHREAHTVLQNISEDRFVLQEYVAGAAYSVGLYLSGEGAVTCGVLRKETLTRVPDIDVASLAVSAVRAIGLLGPSDVDIRRRADGTPAVVEINPCYGAHCATMPEVVEALLQEHEVHAPA